VLDPEWLGTPTLGLAHIPWNGHRSLCGVDFAYQHEDGYRAYGGTPAPDSPKCSICALLQKQREELIATQSELRYYAP
jgi:hypothetical protein